jgi:hypothetical protein
MEAGVSRNGETRGIAGPSKWRAWPHIHGTPAFGTFPDGRAFRYVWAEKDYLKSFQWWGKRFDTTPTLATKLGTHDRLLAPPYLANVPGTDGLPSPAACPAECSP